MNKDSVDGVQEDHLIDHQSVKALMMIFDTVKDHLSIVGRDYTYRQVNSAYERAFGVSRKDIVGKRIPDIFDEDTFVSVIKPNLDRCFSGEEITYRKTFNFPGYASERYMEVRYTPIYEEESCDSDQVIAVVVSSHDLTLMKKTTDQLNNLARIDMLTGLPNRRALDEGLDRFEAAYQRNGSGFSLLFIDLDEFKEVNDIHGHKIGDELLHVLGERFRECFRKDELIGRYGGDEFMAIIPSSMTHEELAGLRNRLEHDIEQPVNVLGHVIKPRISIGVASVPQDGCELQKVIQYADKDMYQHKLLKPSES